MVSAPKRLGTTAVVEEPCSSESLQLLERRC